MFSILDLSFLLLSAIEFLRNSAIQVKFIIIYYYFICSITNLYFINKYEGSSSYCSFMKLNCFITEERPHLAVKVKFIR